MPAQPLHFLAARHLFSAAVVAFQNTPEAEHATPPGKVVAEAFDAATCALIDNERVALVAYVQRLLQLTGKAGNVPLNT